MTPGVTAETVDAMSLEKIDRIIGTLRREAYRWSPVKRICIPKKSGKKRPLGLPPWSDKLVQEVIRLLLDAYYKPRFSDHSHGFRQGRGCHTALREITQKWRGVKWFIEGDIKGCFDNICHEVLLETLSETVRDNRLLRLVSNMLKAGYMEDWRYNATLSGSPQGSVLSPLLSNIYLDKLDRFVEENLLPIYNRGTDAEMTRDTRPSSTPLDEQGIEATMRRRHACVSKRKPCLRVTLKTPTSDGFGMSGMRTIGCSDSAAPDTKPRRSNAASASSFARHCGWNSPRQRR
ncbi:reverse transcriptase/maturase family protein [Microvirga ossetica]|uniref:reverse transcriptase/maturase family protein n=1 Tax=Microvirga ossetica TaxID=1882682 RepID=UPI001F22A59A|nr:reverse transcriptase/maturase family protein [Microvirga ossetica]